MTDTPDLTPGTTARVTIHQSANGPRLALDETYEGVVRDVETHPDTGQPLIVTFDEGTQVSLTAFPVTIEAKADLSEEVTT